MGGTCLWKKAVLIYRSGTQKVVSLPKRTTKKYQDVLNEFKEDKDVVAFLSSNPSQDAYEQYLYPKAKDKSVAYVIKHYKKYFKPIVAGEKMLIPL